jgi:hypothetical protein
LGSDKGVLLPKNHPQSISCSKHILLIKGVSPAGKESRPNQKEKDFRGKNKSID